MSGTDASPVVGLPSADVLLVECLGCGRRAWFRGHEIGVAALRSKARCAGCGSHRVLIAEASATHPPPGGFEARVVEYFNDRSPDGQVLAETSSATLGYRIYDFCRESVPARRHVLLVHRHIRRDSRRDEPTG